MKIQSSSFQHNQSIPQKYTCRGDDISPSLMISDVPKDAKSLALIVEDPDASTGIWVHWIVWNIDPTTSEIQENDVPRGVVEGKTSLGKFGYGGPCPPSGTHRYFFKLYALDGMLNLPQNSGKSDLEEAMEGHIVDQAELVGLSSRLTNKQPYD